MNIEYIAALWLLRNGLTGEPLKKEVQRFCDYMQACKSNGKPILYPEMFLQKSWKPESASNTDFAECGKIADFIEVLECDNLQAICAIERLQIIKGNDLQPELVVYMSATNYEQLETYCKALDNAAERRATAYNDYKQRIGANAMCYKSTEKHTDGKCWVWLHGEWQRVTPEFAHANALHIFRDSCNDEKEKICTN